MTNSDVKKPYDCRAVSYELAYGRLLLLSDFSAH